MKIEDWYCTEKYEKFRFITPSDNMKIGGCVYDHPTIEDGREIKTSIIKSSTEDKVITVNDEVFELGDPHELYVAFLENTLKDVA